MPSFYHMLILFNTWANGKVVESLKTCPELPEKGVELLSHLLQNNWYVLDLIEGRDHGKRWYEMPDYSLGECVENIPLLDEAYQALLESETDVERPVTFVDAAGATVTRTIGELVFHTHDHCTYHRGQIATIVRNAGGEPAKTWFNRWIRETRT